MDKIQVLKNNIKKYEELVRENPGNADLVYWVAFYKEGLAEELSVIGEKEKALKMLFEVKRSYIQASVMGYAVPSNKIETIEKKIEEAQSVVKKAKNTGGAVLLYIIYGVLMFVVGLVFIWWMEGRNDIKEVAPLDYYNIDGDADIANLERIQESVYASNTLGSANGNPGK